MAGVITAHGYAGLVLATLLAGVMLIAAGFAGLGRLIRFIPMPVVTGFTAGIAVIIASSQVGDFLGLNAGKVPADFIGKWAAYVAALGTLQWPTLCVGAATLAIILLLRRSAPQMPAFLIALLAATLAVALLLLPVVTVGERFPSMPTGIPAPHLPVMSLALVQHLLPSAFTIAFLAGIEALLSAVVADAMTGYSHRSGQELVGQGVANLISAMFGALPVTGAIARTATNVRAGGRTPIAGLAHAAFLLLFLTFGLTLLVDLTVAIGVGVTLASLLFMARMSDSAGLMPAEHSVDDPAQRAALPKGVEVFRFAGPMFFSVAGEMLDVLRRSGRTPKIIVLRMERVPYIDSTGAAALEAFFKQAHANGTRVILCDLREQPGAFLERLWPRLVGATRVATFQAALDLLSSQD